jgi:hypothetical protein
MEDNTSEVLVPRLQNVLNARPRCSDGYTNQVRSDRFLFEAIFLQKHRKHTVDRNPFAVRISPKVDQRPMIEIHA